MPREPAAGALGEPPEGPAGAARGSAPGGPPEGGVLGAEPLEPKNNLTPSPMNPLPGTVPMRRTDLLWSASR